MAVHALLSLLYVFSEQVLNRDMPTAGLSPDSFSYSAAIHACERAGDWRGALGVFEKVRRRGDQRFLGGGGGGGGDGAFRAAAGAGSAVDQGAARHSLRIFRSALAACVRGKQHRRALEVRRDPLKGRPQGAQRSVESRPQGAQRSVERPPSRCAEIR